MDRGEFQGRCKIIAETLGRKRGDEYVFDDGAINILYRPDCGDLKVLGGGWCLLTVVGGHVAEDHSYYEHHTEIEEHVRQLSDDL